MSLTERIEARKPREIPEPTPLKVPRWIQWARENQKIVARDETGYVLYDGCGPTGRAA